MHNQLLCYIEGGVCIIYTSSATLLGPAGTMDYKTTGEKPYGARPRQWKISGRGGITIRRRHERLTPTRVTTVGRSSRQGRHDMMRYTVYNVFTYINSYSPVCR